MSYLGNTATFYATPYSFLLKEVQIEDTKSMKRVYSFFGSIAFLLMVFGCAKQTLATKPYHNLTGRYNAYYNANMILAESFEQLNTQHQDNYNQILPLYPYAAVEDAKSVTQQLDEAITKSARNVKLHTIGNWTDDSYHLLGQAEFLQQEYERAANTFKYVVDKYRPEVQEKEKKAAKSKGAKKVKKKRKKRRRRKRVKRRRRRRKPTRKKKPNKTNTKPKEEIEEDEEPEKYGLKHRPVRYESTLWLAKTYIELEHYDEAGYYLRQLENDGTTPYRIRPEIQAVTADYWIRQKEYDKAIPHLEVAVKDTKKKGRKTRYAYILAQLYQQQGNNQLAMEFFHKTLRLKPTYEMEFNARLNMAKNAAQVTGKKPLDPILALRRLLRDPKNQEYRDQIHFAIAQIHLSKGDKEAGIASLQRSLENSQNPAQRTEGALLLAELYYDQDDFVASYAYYDTTLMAMNKKEERYATTTDRKRRLEGVATHLAAKMDHDSMLTVASWDRARQERWAIKGMEREEQMGANATIERGTNFRNRGDRAMGNFEEEGGSRSQLPTRSANGGGVRIMDNELQKSKFALYNPTLRKKGEREFNKRWSSRSWIDDWRRSSKEEDQAVDTDEELAYVPKTQAEIDAYLKRKGVPNSDQEKAEKHKKLATELFLAAQHYREDLNRTDKALELVNELLKKYPTSPYAVEALFLAYNSYREQNNHTKAEYYKTQILNNYPQTNIAKVLSDPDFANAEKKRYEQINDYYDKTYRLLKEGNAQQALDRVNKVEEKFGKDYAMKARFAILQAMCIGGVKGEKDYLRALGIVVTSYPNTTEQEQAKAMIAMLKGNQKGNTAQQRGSGKPTQGGDVAFTFNPRAKHLVIVLFDNTSVKTNPLRSQVSSFHNKYYLNKRLSTSAILVDGKLPSLTIRGAFNTAEEAMKYVRDVTNNPEYLPEVEGYSVYAISRENYALAMTKQKFMAYIPFFKENYE